MPEPVELHVGGKTYRVVASANESELQRLAREVDDRLRDHAAPGTPIATKSLLLVAMSLAHDLKEERDRRRLFEQRSRDRLRSVLARIDAALESADELDRSPADDEFCRPQPPPPPER
jgi:cell division protein ZapA (FtsZ GTPase activity inhibitor)